MDRSSIVRLLLSFFIPKKVIGIINVTDHLNSTRVKFAAKNNDGILYNPITLKKDEILGPCHYYPFRMEMGGGCESLSILSQ